VKSPPPGVRTRGDEPTGARLVLIRHGEAECNARGAAGGPLGDGGLTERGRSQSAALRDRLVNSRELDDAVALYTSTLPRSIETAAIIAPGLRPGLVAVEEIELCELQPGEADAMTWGEMYEAFGAPDWDVDPEAPFAPGGESWTGFYERSQRILTELERRHYGQRVVLVVHGGIIENAMKMFLHEKPSTRLRLRTENCSMSEIEFDGERRRLLSYNDRVPLAAR
jgi:probable phosphoglycerate mutase